jgi:hypothetical protein
MRKGNAILEHNENDAHGLATGKSVDKGPESRARAVVGS